ncbi:MAG: amino acid adenylation domain-containing protein, partial [Acidobacteria bacterium]|nr:amino acid adenylation domain-containing protein [Acidobacteriota bacterium]
HQDVPFERLVEALRPERDLAHSPLFQVMLSLLDEAGEDLSWPGLEVTVEASNSATSKFDLTLHAERSRRGLAWTFEYNADLFEVSTVERLGGHLETLLEAAVREPATPLHRLPLLTAAERGQLEEWNATRRGYGTATCLHRMFEEQAELLPDAIALEYDGRTFDYRTLNRLANVLAHRLRESGVGVDTLVGVFMERSVEMVVALLAILKAGGAYVPLDPDYPAERLGFMAADADMPRVLIQEHLRERLPAAAPEALAVSADELAGAAAAGAPAANDPKPALPDSLAYMIYTSGSTGRPKGVMNSHRGIYNRLLWMQEAYRLDHDDRVLQKTPFSFDVSVWEFFWPLITAARLVVARPGGHQDPSYLAEIIQRRRITTLHFVPSMLQVFVEQADVGACRSLRRVICSGEALPADLVRRFHSRSTAELHNLYGPTEAAIDVTFWHCDRETPRAVVPIGRPIANTQVHVADGHLQVVPVGVPGELLLGGVNLARGYRGRPALTAERFIPDPFSTVPGARLYRTGDETRWAADGVVDFLGRLDFQVKLRGLRIELGEIEAALVEHEAVREAVVLVREDTPGDQRLVAYWVPAAGVEAGENPVREELVGELRRYLRRRLPDYMVPGPFVALEALPLSPNGKVERKALPVPGSERSAAPVYAAPGGGLERDLASLWQEVLKVERVGLDDNFFDLGGHSLLLLQVQRRLEALVPEPPSLVELFQYPTLRSLSAFLRGGEAPAVTRMVEVVEPAAAGERDIALIAAHGRFPGASGIEELWANLEAGLETISFFTDGELERSPFAPGDPSAADFVKAGGVVEGAELFDAGFFGFTPREAEILDPQQRLFLECAWEALELAGIDPGRAVGRIGVWAGAGLNSYLQVNLLSRPEILAASGGYQLMLANDKDFLATRVAYKLGLKGPAVTVQTACSTSLVAVHMACRALRAGECEVALAGGATVRVPQRTGYQYEPSMIQSPDGHCRAFDAEARGTVGGNGVGVVVLKRLSRAKADGDRILAVIKGSAVNNDGSLKVGFTAPAVEGQTEVIAEALADAGVEAASVGYVEAHGTGT